MCYIRRPMEYDEENKIVTTDYDKKATFDDVIENVFLNETIQSLKERKRRKLTSLESYQKKLKKLNFSIDIGDGDNNSSCDLIVKSISSFYCERCAYFPIMFIVICSVMSLYFSQLWSIVLSFTLSASVTGFHFMILQLFYKEEEND